jgi:putative nucleotidyltransferase with HDIG domain
MSSCISKDSFAARKLRAKVAEVVGNDGLELPLLPDTSSQVLCACNSDECDARGLAELIQRDPAMTSHVLRVANSAAYAPEEPIVSLQQAVSRLGIGALCGIAVSVVAHGQVFNLPGHEDRLVQLWRHSTLTAVWSKEVARLRRRNVEGAFLAGLLHDIGKPIVLEAVCGLEQIGGVNLGSDLLEEWLQEFHAEVGGRLLGAWGLPVWVQQAARHHQAPDGAGEHADEVRMVCLGNALAHVSESGDPEARAELAHHPVLQGLGLYVDELEELLAREEQVREVAVVFQ